MTETLRPRWRGEVGDRAGLNLSLDHVDPPGTEGLHAVVNVHDALTLGHVQHHVQDDVTACAASACTEGKRRPAPRKGEEKKGRPGYLPEL